MTVPAEPLLPAVQAVSGAEEGRSKSREIGQKGVTNAENAPVFRENRGVPKAVGELLPELAYRTRTMDSTYWGGFLCTIGMAILSVLWY